MQRLVQRSERATRSITKRKAKKLDQIAKGKLWQADQQRIEANRYIGGLFRESRLRRQEEWTLGPLAPRRDVGDQSETHGSLDVVAFMPPVRIKADQPKSCHLAAGDRVVLLRGLDRGKIGEVADINLENATLTVKDLNMIDLKVPASYRVSQPGSAPTSAAAQPLPIEQVKLVYPLPDPVTGRLRDVVLDRVIVTGQKYSREKGEEVQGHRVVPGANIVIPWPEKKKPRPQKYDDDTYRVDVEEQTFRPFLIRPPMPLSVIDELRNKYSRFRTRHEYEYVMKKELEDGKAQRQEELLKTMHTPLQQLAALRAQQREEQKRELTSEQLAQIGQVIERERAKHGALQEVEI